MKQTLQGATDIACVSTMHMRDNRQQGLHSGLLTRNLCDNRTDQLVSVCNHMVATIQQYICQALTRTVRHSRRVGKIMLCKDVVS
jgi:hypothetical protein